MKMLNLKTLNEIEKEASNKDLLLRIQVRRPLGLWALKVVVAEYLEPQKIKIHGEMKAWAYPGTKGLQLDTMKVDKKAPSGVGHLIWAATMAWALEETPCRQTRLLAIRDDDRKHSLLEHYFLKRGFCIVREVGASPSDLFLRLIWGGAGTLMLADCVNVLDKSYSLWQLNT